MIAMTRARLPARSRARPVVFQPVYIGYEKLIEGNSYLDELTGQAEGEGIDLGADAAASPRCCARTTARSR